MPGLSAIPIIGPVFFDQDPLVYLLYLLVPLLCWLLYRSPGASTSAPPEKIRMPPTTAGVPVFRCASCCTLHQRRPGGIGGAYIVVSQVFVFTEHMSAGKGFIALAAIILGRWDPLGALLAALVSSASAMRCSCACNSPIRRCPIRSSWRFPMLSRSSPLSASMAG